MKSRRNKSEENRAAAASLLADIEEEYSMPERVTNASFENQYLEASPSDDSFNLKPLAEREQTVSNASPKVLAKREQHVSKPLAENDVKIGTVSNASPKVLAKREQHVSKPLAENDVLGLIGKEKRLLFFIFQKCESSGALETPIVTTEELLTNLDVSSVRLRNLIFRLQEQKQLIKVTQVHLGRSGWRRFSLEKDVFQMIRIHLSSEKPLAEREQTVSRASPKALAYPLATPPCSSSNLSINNTTTTLPELEPDLWLSVPKNLEGRVSLKQLRDFVRQGLITPEDLQSSLDGFSYDLAKNAIKSKLGNPVAILIGAVKSGGYISQSYLSELKASMADVERSRLEMQQIQSSLELEQIQKEFESFRAEFPAEAEKFKPTSTYLTNFEPGSVGYKIWLEEYKKHQNTQHSQSANELAL
jgi:hypothetical protein